jgi:hypothetical protein
MRRISTPVVFGRADYQRASPFKLAQARLDDQSQKVGYLN